MAESISIGSISLDLVIKDKLTEQLGKIKAKVSSPAAKIGESMGKSMSEAFVDAGDDLEKQIQAALKAEQKRTEESMKQIEEAAKIPPKAVKMGKYIDYDSKEIEANISNMGDKISEKVHKTAEKAKADLSEVKEEAQAPPEVQVETKTASDKIGLLQKKWQELRSTASHSFSAIKKIGSKAFDGLKNLGGKALNSLKKHIGGIGKSASTVTKPVSKLGRTLKNTFRRVFLVAGIYAAFRAIKDGILELQRLTSNSVHH